jgi:hypothetical protein
MTALNTVEQKGRAGLFPHHANPESSRSQNIKSCSTTFVVHPINHRCTCTAAMQYVVLVVRCVERNLPFLNLPRVVRKAYCKLWGTNMTLTRASLRITKSTVERMLTMHRRR